MTIRSRDRQAAIKHANKMKAISVAANYQLRNHDSKTQKTPEEVRDTYTKAASDSTLPEWARPAARRF
jgi:hypothetical protein